MKKNRHQPASQTSNTTPLLMCYNRNCYKTFASAKGLSVHISKNASCRAFVAQHNLMATINRSCVASNLQHHRACSSTAISRLATLNWYNTQAQRLNPCLCTFVTTPPTAITKCIKHRTEHKQHPRTQLAS